MRLLIDDMRNPEPGTVDVIARTYDAGHALLQKLKWDALFLDHDLGDRDPIKTGRKLLITALATGILPYRVTLITSNPVGRKNMEIDLDSWGYRQTVIAGALWWQLAEGVG